MKPHEIGNHDPGPFKTFEDLEVYQIARELRKAMYRVARRLPEEEKYGLANQMRRAAVSVTNNIAEGHGRFHFLEQIKFGLQSRGSLQELIDDLNVCLDEGYMHEAETSELKREAWRVYQVLNGYLRYLRQRKEGSSTRLNESSPAYGLGEEELDDLLADEAGDPIRRFNDLTI